MVIGDDDMFFNPRNYELTRADVIQHYTNYLYLIENSHISEWDLERAKAAILKLDYNELLILQSSKERWEKLMYDRLDFRMELCNLLNNLNRSHIMSELNLEAGAVSHIFNLKIKTMVKWPGPFQLSVIWNHPWQLINKKNPDPNSFLESPEYFEEGVSRQVELMDLSKERSKVTYISGYVIPDAQTLFQHESAPVPGRWVTTYPEYDYFEFLINYEPLVDKELREKVLRIFPLAKHLVTTFRPFKPLNKRAVWVIIPKDESLPTYGGMLQELKEYRDNTEFHTLK